MLALGGHNFINIFNNQMEVVIRGRRCIEEDEGYWLIHHSHVAVASNGSTMVMVVLVFEEGVFLSNRTIPTPVMVRYHRTGVFTLR